MGIKNESGWIYFNELLYRVLRNRYGNFKCNESLKISQQAGVRKLNQSMQIEELKTQFSLFKLTMGSIKQNKKNSTLLKFFRKVGSGSTDTVNPFLNQMYFRITFLVWYNSMKRFEANQQRRQSLRTLDET